MTHEIPAGEQFQFCRAYGLIIKSWLPLPEFLPVRSVDTDEFDVEIDLGDLPSSDPTGKELTWYIENGNISTTWLEVGKILILERKKMRCMPFTSNNLMRFRLFIGCQGFSLLLHQLGRLVLHASAVDINGHAVLFVADSGGGKSTISSVALAAGHSLVADDMAALSEEQGEWVVRGGYPHMRLSEDTLGHAGIPVTDLDLPIDGTSKLLHPVFDQYKEKSQLARIYVLTFGDSISVIRPSPIEALAQLFAHTYTQQLISQLDPAGHLKQCTRIVSSNKVRVLKRPRDIKLLNQCLEAVVDDLSSSCRVIANQAAE